MARLDLPPLKSEHRVAVWLLAAVGLALYLPTIHHPFIFDDRPAIQDNSSIRQFWSADVALKIPRETTVAGRPILNLSFAVNHAVHGVQVEGYHLLNILIHVLAALTLFGILRRTCLLPRLATRFGARAVWLATVIALLWMAHPLQTESVTYLVQRAESLMGFWYFLSLYSVIRGATSTRPWRWYALSIATCWLGMGTKEVMVSAPLVIFLYDRTFVSGSFRNAWRQRRWLYLGLAIGWIWLAMCLSGGPRASTAGFASHPWWQYALTQPHVLFHYLRLTFAPIGLVIDYADWPLVTHAMASLAPSLILLGIVVTLWALRVSPALGFAGAWVWLILAPTSSVIPIADVAFEHRMYLPLAALITVSVLALDALLKRWNPWTQHVSLGGWLAMAAVLGFGGLTLARNHDYRSELAMWRDVTQKRPQNARAFNNLGVALAEQQRLSDALACYERAIQLDPTYANAHYNLATARMRQEQFEAAIPQYLNTIRLDPLDARARNDLGVALSRTGELEEAMTQFVEAIAIKPEFSDPYTNLGNMFARAGRGSDARLCYQHAAELAPTDAQALSHLQLATVEPD